MPKKEFVLKRAEEEVWNRERELGSEFNRKRSELRAALKTFEEEVHLGDSKVLLDALKGFRETLKKLS